MISLGSRVRDTITGFTGIAVGRTEWMWGYVRYAVEPKGLRDGKPVDAQWFDEPRLVVLAAKRVPSRPTGGPQADPRLSRAMR
ncbi:MAG: hypothetical protein MUP47_03740 [Phycisphaerae bacterium]|nr:hypothetical protein [Phycisphaerae bacterium]